MNTKRNKASRALILIMGALVLLGIIIARVHYRNMNTSIDPRIVEAREIYKKYNAYAQSNALDSVFYLLDKIESIYSRYTHYAESFEVGVLYNNRAATYLTLALYSPLFSADSASQDSLINMAEEVTNKSIRLYSKWMETFMEMDESQIRRHISDEFLMDMDGFAKEDIEIFLSNRVKEIQDAQIETPRRLSVSYTNLGIINRHRKQYDDAVNCYTNALELWDQNLSAENNLNILLGRPLKKRTLIQKLFPPERK